MALGDFKTVVERARASRWLVAGAAAFGLWAFVLNRWVINWIDSGGKNFAIVAIALLLGAAAFVPLIYRWRGPWTRIGFFVLGAFTLGELRRGWLRYQYAVERDGGAPIELFDPVTTTDLVVRHFDVRAPGLGVPRVRVLHLTDLHVTEELPWAYYERIKRELSARKPDLVLFTGDYLSRIERLPLLEQFLSDLPRARYGSFAVFGNHDHWLRDARIEQDLARSGVTLLPGRCTRVPIPDHPGLRLCGTEAPWGPGLGQDDVVKGAPGRGPLLVMTHTPDNVYALNALGATAVFAGHTHGGQMRLPVLGAIIVPSAYGRRFDLGHFKVEGTDLFVSAGVGADEPPLRIYCHPELVEVDFTDAGGG